MGNYKFRLADIMPNAWFYKLRDMRKKPRNQIPSQNLNQKITKKKKKSTAFQNSSSSYSSSPSTTTTTTLSSKPNHQYQYSPRKSYHFTRDLNPRDYPNSPKNPQKPHLENHNFSKHSPRRRRCSTRQSQKQLLTRNSVSARSDTSSEFTAESSPEKEFSGEVEFRCDAILCTDPLAAAKVCSCRAHKQENSKETDIVINVDKASIPENAPDSPPTGKFDSFAKIELPPIITKPSSKTEKKKNNTNNNATKKDNNNHHNNKNSSPGIRLRINHSPRIVNKRAAGLKKGGAASVAAAASSRRSRSLSDSFAVVKSSSDPQKDFRESMIEMIVENNIRTSKDLEDLLACYLSLNSDEYHGMIIKVFKQIWFDLTVIS